MKIFLDREVSDASDRDHLSIIIIRLYHLYKSKANINEIILLIGSALTVISTA